MNGDSAAITRRDLLRGAGGAVGVVGASGTAAAQEDGNASGGNKSGGGNQSGGGGGGGPTKTVEVGPNNDYVFKPGTNESLNITPGTTVKFVWKSDNHNIIPEEQPDGASWKGVPEIHNSGYEYSHTFETLGDYYYICEPHASAGMVGDIKVVETISEDTGPVSILPDSAKTLGVAASGAMTSILALAYVFMKYGGDYSQASGEGE
jgi:plastocyanin